MNAFEKGWIDAEQGKAFKDCPFRKGTPDWMLWRNGYRELYASLGIPL